MTVMAGVRAFGRATYRRPTAEHPLGGMNAVKSRAEIASERDRLLRCYARRVAHELTR